jgi:hypothetical protein
MMEEGGSSTTNRASAVTRPEATLICAWPSGPAELTNPVAETVMSVSSLEVNRSGASSMAVPVSSLTVTTS